MCERFSSSQPCLLQFDYSLTTAADCWHRSDIAETPALSLWALDPQYDTSSASFRVAAYLVGLFHYFIHRINVHHSHRLGVWKYHSGLRQR